jgi:hypothetical protein
VANTECVAIQEKCCKHQTSNLICKMYTDHRRT